MRNVFYLPKNTKYVSHFSDLEIRCVCYFTLVYFVEDGEQSYMGKYFNRHFNLLVTIFSNIHIKFQGALKSCLPQNTKSLKRNSAWKSMNVPENATAQSFLPEQRPRHVSKTATGN